MIKIKFPDTGKILESRSGRWWVFLFWSLFLTGYWLPRNWSFYGGHDWDLTYSMFEVARKSIVEYGIFPEYNPWMAFGSDLNANPQSGHISIFFIPILIFGTYYGYKLSILMAVLLGTAGAFRWFRLIGKDNTYAALVAMIFSAAGYFSSHIFLAGHSNVLYIYLIPWLALCFSAMQQKYRPLYLTGAILIAAQMIAGGAPIVFLIAMAFLGLWVAGRWWIHKDSRLLIPLLTTGICAVVLCLWKIMPGMRLWEHSPRLVRDDSGINLLQWFQSLEGIPFRTGTWHGLFEYNLGFSLILAGIIWYHKQHIPGWKQWTFLALLLIWFCLGNSPDTWNPWYWLNHHIPPFSSMRAPSRFGIIAVTGLCAALAFVLQFSSDKKFITALLVFAAISQGIAFRAEAGFVQDSPQSEGYAQILKPVPDISGSVKEQNFRLIRQGYSIPDAYEPLHLPPVSDTLKSMIRGGKITYFSPRVIEFICEDTSATLNLRYDRNWKIFGPGELHSQNGLLHISGCSGTRRLSYSNPETRRGLWWSLTGLPLVLASHFWLRRRNRGSKSES